MTRNDEQGGVSVRLVRLERQQSRVADDVRAALASLGRGSTVIGGIALVGVGSVTERPIEAVVLLPHGVIIVIGVDLPDPALRLEAPLGAEWKADGWPLVADDDAINPATEALDVSQACERRIASLVPGTGPVGTIVAVGPYVETVDQPASDLAGPVRVLHPTPTTMLAATVSLATAHRPRSVDQVRALIRGLAPEAPEFSDEVLLGEGFSRFTDDSPPESLWDSGPAVPTQPTAAGAAAASTEASAGPATGLAAAADSTAASASPAGAGAAAAASSAEASASRATPSAPAAAAEPASSASGSAEQGSPANGSPAAHPAEAIPSAAGSAEPSSPGGDSPAATPSRQTSPTAGSAQPSSAAEPTSPAANSAEPSSATVGTPVWHTKTPLPAEAGPAPSPAEDSEPAAGSAEADLDSASPISSAEASHLSADSERTEALPPTEDSERTEKLPSSAGSERTQALPAPEDSERTEKLQSPADSERTEKLPSPAQHAPVLPLFPGAVPPQPVRPGDLAADTERTENLTTASEATGPRPTTPERPNQTKPTPPAIPQAAQPQPPADSPQPFPTPRPTPPETVTSKTVRWIPLAAIGLLIALVVAAVAVATSGDDTASAPTGPPTPATQPPPRTSTPVAQSLQFSLRAADHDQRCASHAFGDAQASLQQTSCSGVRRASYAADVDGRGAAVTIGIVEFPDAAQAAAFKAVADTPGGGGVLDLATETGKWGATPAPRFENAAYASKVEGTSVRLVQAVWAPGPSTPDDPGLTRAVQAALDLPAQ
ncbi:hypothetical protein ACIRSS_38330 [Amycolatopsis sp. NPDC101161]|uniref:hypothetical protein n=1 Tax=Amycolatopsis sp. NPDC101161 TaxID=3363940 RepID=UPI003812BD96